MQNSKIAIVLRTTMRRWIDHYETMNGLTLCIECHQMFDAHLCYVAVTKAKKGPRRLKLKVADAVLTMDDERKRTRWGNLDGRLIIPPARIELAGMFPTPDLLNYRKELFEKAREKRHAAHEGER